MLLHVSFTSNHHQVDITLHGQDMFSAYSMGVLFVTNNTHLVTHAGTSSSLLYKT
jgi:hypothetical protein